MISLLDFELNRNPLSNFDGLESKSLTIRFVGPHHLSLFWMYKKISHLDYYIPQRELSD